MKTQQAEPGRGRRLFGDIVMAEMFLVQATIESAAAIGNGLNALGKQFDSDTDASETAETYSSVIQRTAEEAIEPYTSRFKYLRELMEKDS